MTRAIERYPLSVLALCVAAALIIGAAILSEPHTAHSQTSNVPINGYAWSDNIGWISLNCATGGPNESNICGTSNYGLTIDGSGNVTGYAWSDNLGWISANPSDLTGCPSAPCTATLNSSGAMNGWLKVLAPNDTSWSGWISLSGTSPNYGVTETSGIFSGYAWAYVMGWTDFEYASTTYGTCTASTVYSCTGAGNQTITQTTTGTSCVVTQTNLATCVSPGFCSAGSSTCLYPSPSPVTNLTATPLLVPHGGTTQISWSINNINSCSVSGTNGDGPWTGALSNNTDSGNVTSGAINSATTYTLTCIEEDGVTKYTQSISVGVVPTYQEQ